MTTWTPAKWADVRTDDFIRVKGTVFKVIDRENAGTIALKPETGPVQTGRPKQDGRVEIRTEFRGEPTPAGTRLAGELPFPEIEALLKEKLDAELIAWQTVPEHRDSRFTPWVTPEFGPKSDVRELGSHLFVCHGIETGSGIKSRTELSAKAWAEQRASLLEAHEEAHRADACERYDSPRRLPHVHHGGRK